MPKKTLEDTQPVYEPDWSDKIEPWTSAISLAGDAIGLTTALTGVGAPIGAVIARVGNVPNLIIDGYQTVRDWNKVYNYNGSIKDALWNTAELGLDLVGAKFAMKGAKAINDRKFINELKYKYEQELVKRNKKKWSFLKSKMTDAELAEYISQKALNAAINSKHVADIRREYPKRTRNTAQILKSVINVPQNAYHSAELIQPNDNTRNNRRITLRTDFKR